MNNSTAPTVIVGGGFVGLFTALYLNHDGYPDPNLVLGVGSSQGYFGTKGAKENAFPLRTGADAVKLERHIRQCLQRASQTESQAERSKLLTFAVVGSGHSGVEMAATLADRICPFLIEILIPN